MTIAENLNRIEQAKADIKTAIESKGVYIDAADRIDTYAAAIASIEQGGGGSCNLGVLEMEIPETGQLYREAFEDGLDGYNLVNVNAYEFGYKQNKQGQGFVLLGFGEGDGMSAETPWNTAQVKGYVYTSMQDKEGQTTKDSFYIQGTVMDIGELRSGRLTFSIGYKGDYWIECSNTKYLDGQSFPSEDALKIGDIVVVYGRIQTSSYEPYRIPTGTLIAFKEDEDVTTPDPINMKGLRFYNNDLTTFENYILTDVVDYNKFFYGLPNLTSNISIKLKQDVEANEMFAYVATNTENGVNIIIDCDGHRINGGNEMFKSCKLRTIPSIKNLADDCLIGEYNILGQSEIINWSNSSWTRWPFEKMRDMNCFFSNQRNLVNVPDLSLPNLEVANGMFEYCENLETVGNLGISNVGAFSTVFKDCGKLTSIGDLGNFENCWQFDNPFEGCTNLVTFPRMHNLKKSLDISHMVQLDTGLALLFIVNDFYNFVENGVTPNGDEGVIKFPSYFQNDENWESRRDHLTNMGWTVEIAE